MEPDLAQALWQAPLSDPDTPARDLNERLSQIGYPELLNRLRQLQGHGLPLQPALTAALTQYPWSIDLAALAFHVDPCTASLAGVERVVRAQNRRFGVLSWAYWALGDVDKALETLANLEPNSQSFHADQLARAELCILADKPAEDLPGAAGLRLSLLQTWRKHGAVALSRRFDLEAAGFPAAPALWDWLLDVFIAECDFRRAYKTRALAAERLGAAHPDIISLTIRLALEAGEAETARTLLAQVTDGASVWDWPPRQHTQHLRSTLLGAQTPDKRATVLDHATRAHRLYPDNAVLQGLWLAARERVEDWDMLAKSLTSDNSHYALKVNCLSHIGLHQPALDLCQSAAHATPDQGFQSRLIQARLLLHMGQLSAAAEALGPVPTTWPQIADHAYWAAEVHLARRDNVAAQTVLDQALALGPTRMGLLLNRARAAFLAGQFDQACEILTRFDALKSAQLGRPPSRDLRNRITEDAQNAAATGRPALQSPGLAAHHFALSAPAFTPARGPARIPRKLAHYWEGPRSAPVERGIRAWARHHPDMRQDVFDRAAAHNWLQTHAPELVDLFNRQTLPATRADLFRVALIAHQGGIFSDLDEYPRGPITAWLDSAVAVLVIETGYGTIANNFLAALPRLPLFMRLQDRIATELARTSDPYPWWHCGPAQLTLQALAAQQSPIETTGLRFLSQAAYDQKVATNLPFPHKHTPDHWRS